MSLVGISGMDKFLSRRSIFRARQKMGAQNQSARVIETQLERFLFILYYPNSTYSFIF